MQQNACGNLNFSPASKVGIQSLMQVRTSRDIAIGLQNTCDCARGNCLRVHFSRHLNIRNIDTASVQYLQKKRAVIQDTLIQNNSKYRIVQLHQQY